MRLKGFTLLEILLCLVLLAILTVMTVNSFGAFFFKNEQQVIINEIRTAVQYAKNQALTKGTSMTLSPLDTWTSGMELSSFNPQTNKVEKLYQWQWQHPAWIVEWKGVGSDRSITFASNPLNLLCNGHFSVRKVGNSKAVVIVLNRLGRVRVVI